MTPNPLKKYVLSALLLPSTVFCASTLPLAVLSSQEVAIELQDETVFTGQIREIATPYLALATTLSAVVGVAGVAITGWQQSKGQSARLEAQLAQHQKALKTTEEKLEELKLSTPVLEASGLENFIEEREPKVARVAPIKVESSETQNPVREEIQDLKSLDLTVSSPSESTDRIEAVQNQVHQMKSQLEVLQQALASASNAVVFDSSISDLAKSS